MPLVSSLWIISFTVVFSCAGLQFTLREILRDDNEPRLFFSRDDPTDDAFNGEFMFTAARTPVEVTVTVHAMVCHDMYCTVYVLACTAC